MCVGYFARMDKGEGAKVPFVDPKMNDIVDSLMSYELRRLFPIHYFTHVYSSGYMAMK